MAKSRKPVFPPLLPQRYTQVSRVMGEHGRDLNTQPQLDLHRFDRDLPDNVMNLGRLMTGAQAGEAAALDLSLVDPADLEAAAAAQVYLATPGSVFPTYETGA